MAKNPVYCWKLLTLHAARLVEQDFQEDICVHQKAHRHSFALCCNSTAVNSLPMSARPPAQLNLKPGGLADCVNSPGCSARKLRNARSCFRDSSGSDSILATMASR